MKITEIKQLIAQHQALNKELSGAIDAEYLKEKGVPLKALSKQDKLPLFRYGTQNPERIKDNIYFYIITNQATPYQLRNLFKDKGWAEGDAFKRYVNAHLPKPIHSIADKRVWNYNRFGTSRTLLPDGSMVFIGGEHEDFYDPDFCIFNDVLKVHADGKMELFFYPISHFPPTDFHTATYYEGYNSIIIIGNLGYDKDRKPLETPVYRFDLSQFHMTEMKSIGEKPGWIYKHNAFEYQGEIVVYGGTKVDGKKYVENENIYSFNPRTHIWTLLE